MRQFSGLAGLWLGLALAMLLPVSVGLGRLSPAAAGAVFLFSSMIVLLGRALGILLRVPRRPGFIAAFEIVAGFVAFSLLQLGATMALNLTAVEALAVTAAVTAVLLLWTGERSRGTATPPDVMARPGWDAAVLVALSLLVTLWSGEALTSLHRAEAQGIFRPEIDFFYHGAEVNYLKRFPSFAGQSPFVAGTPRYVYHEGSYALAALFSGLTGELGLQAALVFWLPAGLLLLGIGAYGFGSALDGRAAGTAAALAPFLIPDASRYGLREAFLSYHWLTEVSPALGYGIAIVLTALALFAAGIRDSRFDLMVKATALAALSAFFKVQIAVLAALLFAWLILVNWRPPRTWHRPAAIAGLAVIAAGTVVLFEHIALAPHFLSGHYEFTRLFVGMDRFTEPPFRGLWARLSVNAPMWLKGVIGVGLLLPGAFGAALPAAAILSLAPFRARWPRQFHAIPFVLLVAYLAMIFLIPAAGNESDPTEFSHRPFVLVYAVLVSSLAASAVAILRQAEAGRGWLRPVSLALGLLLAAGGLASAWVVSSNVQQMGNLINTNNVIMAPGMFRAARFIREHARPDDWVLSSDGDTLAVVAALTERPAFLSMTIAYRKYPDPRVAGIFRTRYRLGMALQHMRTYEELERFGRQYGVRWFLLLPGDMPKWTGSILGHGIFESDHAMVFDLETAGRTAPAP